MLSKNNAVEKDPFPRQLFTASVFRSAVFMLIDFWLFFGGVHGNAEKGLSTFKKIKWRARCGAPKLHPRLFKQVPSYAPHTQQTVSRIIFV